jgi:hypothetical protein
MRNALALIFALTIFSSGEPSGAKLYFLYDAGHEEWCLYSSQKTWETDVNALQAANVGSLEFENEHIMSVDVTTQDETGDWVVYDHYLLDTAGELRQDKRKINVLPGDRTVEETYLIQDGKTTKTSSSTKSLSSGKSLLTHEDWTPEVPVTKRVKDFPFVSLMRFTYHEVQSKGKVCTDIRKP